MNKDHVALLGVSIATIISIWFGISILNPRLVGRAQYENCIGGAADTGSLSPDLSKVCSHLR